MIVTSIEKQKKKGRYNLFLDGEFAFGIYEDTLVKYSLRKNDALSGEKINEIKDYDEFNYGKKVAYDYLGYSQRSEKELRLKLKQKKISSANLEKVIQFFMSHKFLNDEGYAVSFIRNEIMKKPSGKRLIYKKMIQKGIDKEIIEKVLAEEYPDESECALNLLEKYSRKFKKEIPLKQKQKAYNHLLSRGFDFDVSKKIVDEFFGN